MMETVPEFTEQASEVTWETDIKKNIAQGNKNHSQDGHYNANIRFNGDRKYCQDMDK